MTEIVGEKNAYRCKTCGGVIVTENVDEGTTPMFLACRATEGCSGRSVSLMFRLPPDLEERDPDFEWYAPTDDELDGEPPEVLDHVERGGLLLRPVGAGG